MDTYGDYINKTEEDSEDEKCPHKETIIVNNTEVCEICGEVIQNEFYDNKDWKFYGTTEQKFSKDPMRTHKRKSDQRSILKDVESMDFPESVVKSANKKYQKIIKKNIYRGANRKAIIIVCLHYAYLDQGEYITIDDISKKFEKVKKKNIKEAMQKYCEEFPDASTTYATPSNLVRQIMIKTNIDFSHLAKIIKLCKYFENRSELLNRSNPKSVASAIVYLYLTTIPEYKKKLGLTEMNYANLVGLSDITISKIVKEAQSILKQNNKKN